MISSILLTGFRNYKKQKFVFGGGITVVVGPNASGKTNLLEALYLLSTGKSFKARLEEEMVGYKAQIARIVGIADSREKKVNLEAILTHGEIRIGEDPDHIQKTPRKRLLVNGIPRRLIDFAGNLKSVLFGPWDLDLVTREPSLRRRFLDMVLSQVDREYRRAILSYEKGLRQRNRLLFRIREEGISRSQLLFWNQLLIRNGDYISNKREELINYFNESQFKHFENDYKISYDRSAISEGRLVQYAAEEVAAATTLVGPHRDDILIKIRNSKSEIQNSSLRNLATYGSRGEQRMGVLWLKMCELKFIYEKTGEKPVLLLDDIFSELDHPHRKQAFALAANQQTILTTADEHYLADFPKADIIRV